MTSMRPTAERLMQLLEYNPENGVFTRRFNRGAKKAGSVAGKVSNVSRENGGGYRWISIDGKKYRAHRLAWLYVAGEWPTAEIDHRNLDRDDNRWANLREATHAQNQANSPMRSTNTSGLKGAFFHKQTGRWRAAIGKVHLGYFDTAQEAHVIYAEAAEKKYGEFARAT